MDYNQRGRSNATSFKDTQIILKLAEVNSNDIFCDLGCGNGDELGYGIMERTPILSTVLKSLGAEVYAIDLHDAHNNFWNHTGINYLDQGFNDPDANLDDSIYFKNNDIIIARS